MENPLNGRTHRFGFGMRGAAVFAALMILVLVFTQVAFGANPAPVQIFYVPVDEDDALASLATINAASVSPVQSYISIAIGTTGTIIYYDQWENGFFADMANVDIYASPGNTDGTQIWGNGKAADGCPPNTNGTTPLVCSDANDVLVAGNVIVLNSAVSDLTGPTARQVIDFDGGDKVGATEQIAVSRVYWAAGANTLSAGAVEVYGTDAWGVSYQAPVGQAAVVSTSTVTQVGTATSAVATSGTSITVNKPTGVVAGDVLIAIVSWGNDTTAGITNAPPADWTELTGTDMNSTSGNDGRQEVYYKVAGASEPANYTFANGAPLDMLGAIVAYRGAGTPTANAQENGSSVNNTAPDISYPANSIILHAGSVNYGTTRTGPAAYTEFLDIQSGSGAAEWTLAVSSRQAGAAGSTGAINATWADADNNAGAHIVIPPQVVTTSDFSQMFEYTALSIQAGVGGATVTVDPDGPGPQAALAPIVLLEGESRVVNNIVQGATVTSNLPVQVDMLTGDVGSSYEYSAYTLLPKPAWGNSYWSPVSGALSGGADGGTYQTQITVFNPDPVNAINVRCEFQSTGSTQSVPAGGALAWTVPLNSGAHCFTVTTPGGSTYAPNGPQFFTIGTVDSAFLEGGSADGSTYDWGFTLIPDSFLDTQALVGLGLGRDPTSGTNPNENGSPVWVTPACAAPATNTYVYVDFNGDGTPDDADLNGDNDTADTVNGVVEANVSNGVLLPTLQSIRFFDSTDRNQTGAQIYSLTGANSTGTPGCRLAVAWGEDPGPASGGAPGFDVGTTVPPLLSLSAAKLVKDLNNVAYVTPGDTLLYTISVKNTSRFGTFDSVSISDTIPAGTTYVANSTFKNIGGGPVAVPDNGSPTIFPLDQGGIVVGANLGPLQTWTVSFKVKINDVISCDANIDNTAFVLGQRGVFTYKQPAKVISPVDCPAKLVIIKTATGPASTIVPGFDYTLVSSATLPPGVLVSPQIVTPPAINSSQALTISLPAGVYTVTEQVEADWTLGSIVCTAGGTPVNPPLTTRKARYVLPEAGVVKCTWTNSRDTGVIRVVKDVVPDAPSTQWTMTGTGGPTAFNGVITGDGFFTRTIATGTYGVTESGASTALYNTTWSCSATTPTAGPVTGSGLVLTGIVVQKGQSWICTFTNTRKVGSITIQKVGIGGNGTFSYTTTGGLTNPFNIATTGYVQGVSNSSGNQQFVSQPTGSYTVVENGPPTGWDFTSLSCSGGGANTTIAGQTATIGLDEGETIICTYTNTKRGSLLVTKVVDWNGLPVDSTQKFTITVTGPSYPSGNTRTYGGGDPLTFTYTNLIPGSYTVVENAPTAGQGWVITVTPGNPQVQAGQQASVTVTNKRNQGTLLVSKVVNPTYTRRFDWQIKKVVTPATVNLFDGQTGTLSYTVAVTKSAPINELHRITGTVTIQNNGVTPAIVNTVVDKLATGTTVPLTCPTLPATINAGNSIVCTYNFLTGGQITTTNRVTVTTNISTVYTGTAPVAFGQPTTTIRDSINVTDTNGPSGVFNTTGSFPYQQPVNCASQTNYINGKATFLRNNTAQIVQTGQNSTASSTINCYRLTVQKDASTSLTRTWDWDIFKVVTPTALTLFEDQSAVLTYTVGVTKGLSTDSNWAANGVITVTNPAPMVAPLSSLTDVLLNGSTPVASPAPACPGGTTVPANGKINCTYATPLTNANALTNRAVAVIAGKNYTGTASVSFANPTVTKVNDTVHVTDTYTTTVFGPWSTNNSDGYERPVDCANVTYGVNGTATFPITNTAKISETTDTASALVPVTCIQYGKIIVEKQTNPAGNTQLFSFTASYTSPFQLADNGTKTVGGLVPGTYSVTETVPSKWDLTGVRCSDQSDPDAISLQAGETITCTFTNTQWATLIVEKVATDPANAAVPPAFNFTVVSSATLPPGVLPAPFSLTPTVLGIGVTASYSLPVGVYTVTEALQTDWTLTNLTCTDANGTPVPPAPASRKARYSLPAGGVVKCTWTNTRDTGTIRVTKVLTPSTDAGLFNLQIQGVTFAGAVGNGGDTGTLTLHTGTKTVGETGAAGTNLANYSNSIACVNLATGQVVYSGVGSLLTGVVLSNGLNLVCTITNIRPEARISITPLTATNEVGTNHTFTVTVEKNDGTVWAAAPGVTVTPTASGAGGILASPNGGTCQTGVTNANGQCTIIISSTSAGLTTVNASASVAVLNQNLLVTTTGNTGQYGPAVKTWVDAAIKLNPLTATNAVGQAHTITATVTTTNGVTPGFAPAGTLVTFSLTGGGSFVAGNTCTTVGATGKCSVQITSPVGAVISIHGATNVVVGGLTLHRETDGSGSNSGNAQKTYVNLRVRIDPQTDANPLNLEHTFTISITQDLGNGVWAPVADGVTATVTIAPQPAGFTLVSNSCATPGTVGGLCTVVINSSVAQLYTANASVTTNVSGQSITRSTLNDPANIAAGGTDGADKTYREGALDITKTVEPSYTRTYSWTVEKVVDPTALDLFDGESAPVTYTVQVTKDAGTDSAFQIAGSITFSNTSADPVVINQPVDALADGTPISLNCSPAIFPYTIPGNGQLVCTYIKTGLPGAVDTTNHVTVTTTSGSVFTQTAAVDFGEPTLKVNDAVTVTDTNTGTLGTNVSASATYKYSLPLSCSTQTMGGYVNGKSTGTKSNTATVKSNDGLEDSDDATVDVSCYRLTVQKDAKPTLTRTWNWEINKVVTPTVVNLFEDQTAPLSYTVQVTKSSPVDSAWAATGTITVTNPAPMNANLTSVTDTLPGSSPLVTCGTLVVSPAGTLTCTYAATGLPNGSTQINTAVAVLAGKNYTGTATVNFANASVTPVNPTITITDTNLPTTTWSAGATKSFTYTLPADCSNIDYSGGLGTKTLPNVAQIVETGQNDDASVRVNCTQYSTIIVEKQTKPAGSSQLFQFTSTFTNPFSLADNGAKSVGGLVPSTYGVTETVPAGWAQTGATCSDGSQPAAIGLGAAETVTCTFTNTQGLARIYFDTPVATNTVGSPHIFTVTVESSVDNGATWQPVGPGQVVTGTRLSGPGSPLIQLCTTNAAGKCALTLNSNIGGQDTLRAQAMVDVLGLDTLVTTSGTSGLSRNALKTWVDASILLTPDSASNEVNDEHVVTATVLTDVGGVLGLAADGTVVTFTVNGGPYANQVSTATVTGGTGQVSLTINSAVAGEILIHAATDVVVAGLTVHRETGSDVNPGADAYKWYVDAAINLTPLTATNAVSQTHIVTATVTTHDGNVPGLAPFGTVVTFTIDSGVFVGGNTCTTVLGQCSVTINSTSATTISIHAETDVLVQAYVTNTLHRLHRETGTAGNGDDATKTYVNLRVRIAPQSDINPVNQAHTFTVTVEKNEGSGWAPMVGVTPTVAYSPIPSTPGVSPVDCGPTNAAGQCTVVINSPTPGVFNANATVTATVSGEVITRSTLNDPANIAAGGSDGAGKTYVSGQIIVEKQTVPNGSTEVFTFTTSFTNPFGLSDNEQKNSGELAPGIYGVTETVPAGWAQTGATCSDGSQPAAIGLGSAETVTCTFTNTKGLARIYFDTPVATNTVGSPHIFTVTVESSVDNGASWQPVGPGQVVTGTIIAGVGSPLVQFCFTNGSGKCALTVNSPAGGQTTLRAQATVDVLGLDTLVTTSGTSGLSRNALKIWVNAAISVDPDFVSNEVNDEHIVTATVLTDIGGVFGVAADGTVVTFTVNGGPYANQVFTGTVTGGTGQVSLTINSAVAGEITINAATDVVVAGLTLHRETGTDGNGGTAYKYYVDAAIKLTPLDATNQVGDEHVLTATVTISNGTSSGFALPGTLVTFTVNGGPYSNAVFTSTVGANGQATLTISSTVGAVITIHAATDVLVLSDPVGQLHRLHRETDGTGGNSGDATKTYVNLRVRIDPQTDTNPVNLQHTFTVSVTQNLGAGWVPVSDGVTATVTIAPQPAGFTLVSDGCASTGTVGGLCTVVINSSVAQLYTANATVTTSVSSQSITRSTLNDPANLAAGGSDGAEKTYREGALDITKTVEPSYTRTYSWTVEKVVDPTALDLFDGEVAPVTYTVKVTKDAGTDSAFQIAGTVTFSNTSANPVIINQPVDALADGTPISLNCGPAIFPYTIPGNGSLVCTYIKTGLPGAIDTTNHVTVTTTSGSTFTETAAVDFGEPTLKVNDTITATDTNTGTLGTGVSGTSTFTYSLPLSCANLSDTQYVNGVATYPKNNTATIKSSDGLEESDDARVDVTCYRLTVEKDASTSLTRTWDWDILKVVTPTQVSLYDGQTAPLSYTVMVTKTGLYTDSAWAASGTITVTNPAPLIAELDSVTDTLGSFGSVPVVCSTLDVPANSSITCTYQTSLPSALDGLNTAAAMLFGKQYTGSANVDFEAPKVTEVYTDVTVIDTNPQGPLTTTLGTDITGNRTFTYEEVADCSNIEYSGGTGFKILPNIATIVETGDNDDASVRVDCSKLGDLVVTKSVDWNGFDPVPGQGFSICVSGPSLNNSCVTLTDTARYTFTNLIAGQYVVTETAPTGYQLVNIVGSPASVPAGGSDEVNVYNKRVQGIVVVVKTADETFTRTFDWTIEKVVNPSTLDLFDGQGAPVTYTVAVTKSAGLDSAWNVSGTISLNNSSGNTAVISDVVDFLTNGQETTVNCPVGFPYNLPDAGSLVCTYTEPVGSALVGVTNVVTVTLSNSDIFTDTEPVVFGEPTLKVNDAVTVTDTNTGTLGTNVSASATYKYSLPLSCSTQTMGGYVNGKSTGTKSNTATVKSSEGINKSDDASVLVNCYQLKVEKTAKPTYTLTTTWAITKAVTPSSVDLFEGQTAPLSYTVKVTKTGQIAGLFAVTGAITVTNPNPTQSATLSNLTDQLSNGDVMVVACGSALVPAGGKLGCTYSGGVNSVNPALVVTNTAKATFLGKEYVGTAQANFANATVTQVNPSITVTDTNPPGSGSTLGTGVTGNTTFKYTLTADCSNIQYSGGIGSKTIPNVAQIVQTGQNDDALATIKCTQYGHLIVEKQTGPNNDPTVFNFKVGPQGGASTPFTLTDGTNRSFTVIPGTYVVTETVPSGWQLESVVCEEQGPISPQGVDAANPKTIAIAAGTTIKCTFTNTKRGTLVIKKVAPDKPTQLFTFQGAVTGTIAHGGSLSKLLPPGFYSVSEVQVPGWTLRGISPNCQGESPVGSVDVQVIGGTAFAEVLPGLTTTCVFTNSLPSIVTTKTATPAQVPNPGAQVFFDVSVKNTSKLDPVTITSLTDTVYGDITFTQPTNPKLLTTTCALGTTLQPGQTYNCVFSALVKIADNATVAFEETDIVTAKGITDFKVEVKDDDDAKVVVPCAGQIIQGVVFYDPNKNNIMDVGEFPFKLTPSLPANEKIESPVELLSFDSGGNPLGSALQVTVNGAFKFTNVQIGPDYTLRVADAALSSFGFQPTVSSVDVDAAPKTCVPYVKNFGYYRVEALIGDYVWYDVNVNKQQDEWYDANGDGQITKNTGTFSLSTWEFADVNGNNIADLPEELNTCAATGLAFASATGPDITITGVAPQKTIRPLSTTGYYRFSTINSGDNTGPTAPLSPTGTYVVSINPLDAKLRTAGVFYLTKRGTAQSCKPIPAGSPITPSLPGGGAPPPLMININPDGTVDTAEVGSASNGGVVAAGSQTVACGLTTPKSDSVDLSGEADGIYLDADFGVVCVADTASLGNRVWEDINPNATTTPGELAGDGLQNSPLETGVTAVTVELWSPGADGVVGGVDDTRVATTTTDAQGNYGFTGVIPGKYYLVFIKPAGSTAWWSPPNVGSDPAVDSDVKVDGSNPNKAVTGLITLVAGQDDQTWDAAIINTSGAGSSDLGDFVWEDKNKNGIQDAGEPGLEGLLVQLFQVPTDAAAAGVNDTLIATDTTDANGIYGFLGLDPATYYVIVQVPNGYTVSPQFAGTDRAKDSNITPAGRSDNVVLPISTANLTIDGGMFITPTNDPIPNEPGALHLYLPTIQK